MEEELTYREIARFESNHTSAKVRIIEVEDIDELMEGKGEYIAEYNYEDEQNEEDWLIMGGTVGYRDSSFKTLEEAIQFVAKGLREEGDNPDIWLEMLEV